MALITYLYIHKKISIKGDESGLVLYLFFFLFFSLLLEVEQYSLSNLCTGKFPLYCFPRKKPCARNLFSPRYFVMGRFSPPWQPLCKIIFYP